MSEHCYILGCRYPDSCDHIERTPPASPEEHRRVQAEAAAMRRALEQIVSGLADESPEAEDFGAQIPGLAESTLSSSAGSALLEEMAEAQAQRDAMTDNCHRLMAERDAARAKDSCVCQGRGYVEQEDSPNDAYCDCLKGRLLQSTDESADLRARLAEDEKWMASAMEAIKGLSAGPASFTGHPVVDVVAELRARLEAVEKERDGAVRDLDGLREAWGNERAEFVQRDAALRLAMNQGLEAGVEEVVVALAQEKMAADAHAPAAWCAAEVRRAVEAEREAIRRVILGGSFLHDQSPQAVWARQLVAAIDRDMEKRSRGGA